MSTEASRMTEVWARISEVGVLYGVRVVAALAVFLVGKWAARMVARLIGRSFERTHIETTLATFLRNVAYYALLAFVIITALGQLGVQTTSFVALIGAAGLAVGLALQGSLANFAAGVLLSKRPAPRAR